MKKMVIVFLITVVVLVIVYLIVVHNVPIDARGTTLPRDGGFLLVCNHPMPYGILTAYDVALVDRFVREQEFDVMSHVLVSFPHSLGHQLLTRLKYSSGTTTLVAYHKNGTTQQIVEKLDKGENVVAFIHPNNTSTGLAWALKMTQVPCYTMHIGPSMNTLVTRRFLYDDLSDPQDLADEIRLKVNTPDHESAYSE